MIALQFFLAEPNLRTAVFYLTSNSSENWVGEFLMLGFSRLSNIPTSIGLLSARPLGVATMYYFIMALYWCWLSYLTEYLYKILIFYKQIYSYRELLCNNFPTPMVTIYWLNCSNFNKPFSNKHCCSNHSTEKIVSTTFIKDIYLSRFGDCSVLP